MAATRPQIGLKRVYDSPQESDGARVLVDRLWPRGLSKNDARVDDWMRDLAPSNELRKWFHSHTEKWQEFREKYLKELRSSGAAEAVSHLAQVLLDNDRITLLFASKDTGHNNAVVLKELMEGVKKPPQITRPDSTQPRARKRQRHL